MSTIEIPFRIFKKILFGDLRPNILQKTYEQEGMGPFEAFWDMPETPEVYIRLRELFINDDTAIDDFPEFFPSLFFVQVSGFTRDIHPLCRFYDHLVASESKLLVERLTEWRETHPLMMLSYQIINVQDTLVEFLKELHNRKSSERYASEPLQAYVLDSLFAALLVLLNDIQLRFGYLIDRRVISIDRLNVIHLKRPVPDTPEVMLTQEGATFIVQNIKPDERINAYVKYLHDLHSLPKDFSHLRTKEKKKVFEILENALLIHWITVKSSDNLKLTGREPDENKEFLVKLYKAIKSGEHSKNLVDSIIEGLDELRELLHCNEDTQNSISSRILIELKTLLTVDNKPIKQHVIESNHTIFSKYIKKEDLLKELDVSLVTLNKYLKEAGIKAIKFSQKEVYLHRKEYEKFKEYYSSKF